MHEIILVTSGPVKDLHLGLRVECLLRYTEAGISRDLESLGRVASIPGIVASPTVPPEKLLPQIEGLDSPALDRAPLNFKEVGLYQLIGLFGVSEFREIDFWMIPPEINR